ncbi:MAG TPA: peptidoglycan-binding protein, partial [Burkholderiales bacterium]|nr:peptidoglycan-binding protein [Burkholderiales bacterium]
NVVQKIVSAPFRALTAIFGGKQAGDPGNVAFVPGSAELSPPAEENVARVARGLAQRPGLGVEVHGAYDPARDLEALRMRAARRDIARAAGTEGSAELSDPATLRAAEKLYLERGGDRATLEALRKSEERYGRSLLQKLAATVNVEQAAAQALAHERADAVRAALIEHGIDPARVRIGDAVEKQATKEGVETGLALAAGFASDAAAGASQPAPAPQAPDDPVREAQRRLNAAGYEAGPVDGILGPRTKRALIHYQAVQGLKLTGELDAATHERLEAGAL